MPGTEPKLCDIFLGCDPVPVHVTTSKNLGSFLNVQLTYSVPEPLTPDHEPKVKPLVLKAVTLPVSSASAELLLEAKPFNTPLSVSNKAC